MSAQAQGIRVGIELQPTGGQLTGIGNYRLHLLRALVDGDAGLEFAAFGDIGWSSLAGDDLRRTVRAQDEADGIKAGPSPRRSLRAQVQLALSRSNLARSIVRRVRGTAFAQTVERQSLDLFHAFHFMPPADPGVPTLPVIYDLSAVRYPASHPRERLQWLQRLPKFIERASLLQTISEFTRTEIASTYGYPKERILVAPPAAAPIFKPLGTGPTEKALHAFELRPGAYHLAVGTLEPRKNLRTLIAAFGRLAKDERTQAPLAIVGGAGWGDLELPKETDTLLQEGSLRFVGAVSNAQLRSLYEGATALFVPSLYEGFGMPAVEAMSCGTAVVHSKDTSMDEITADHALRIPAEDVEAWTAAIRSVRDGSFGSDPDSRSARIKQAARYDWHASAATVRAAYRTLVGR